MKTSNSVLMRGAALLVLVLVGMTQLGAAELFNPEGAGTQEWTYTGHSDIVRGVAVDGDGNVYSGSGDGEVHKIDSDGNNVWEYTEHTEDVYGVAVDNDGNVYSASRDDELHKIDSDGNNVWEYTEHTSAVRGVAVDGDGNVYSGSGDDEVHKIDSNGDQVWTYSGHTGTVFSVAVDQDGNVYSVSSDGEVHKIDSDGNNVWEYTEHTDNVWSVTVDSDGNVYSGSGDDEVHKIDSNGDQVWTYSGHTGNVFSVAVDQDGNVYSVSSDDELHKIDSDGNNVWEYTGHTDGVYGVAVDSDGNVYSGSLDEEVHKLSFNQPPEFQDLSSDPEPPQIGRNVSYFADLTDPDDDSELESVELQLEYGGQQVYQESRSVSGHQDYASWNDVFVPEDTNQWLNASFTATDTEGDETSESLDYFLDDTPPEVNIVSPENQTYWSYDMPYEIEVDSNNDAVPDQEFGLELYNDEELIEELSGSGTETFSGEFRQDLGESIEFEARANDSGGETSETETYSVELFRFNQFSASNTVFETVQEQFTSNQDVGEMVETIEYTLVYDSIEEETLTESYEEYDTYTESIDFNIPLVNEDGTEKNWYFEANITYEDFNDETETVETVETGEQQSQEVMHSFVLDEEFLDNGSPQLEASELFYNANVSQETSDAEGELTGEVEYSQTSNSNLLDKEEEENTSRLFTTSFDSELVSETSETFNFDLDIQYEFEGDSRSISSNDLEVDLDRIELTGDSSEGDEALRFETMDEEDQSSLDSDLEVNFEVYNPDQEDLTREYDLEFEDSDEHSVYFVPGYGEVVVDVYGDNYIEYSASGDNEDLYDSRNHYLIEETLSNETTVTELYLLDSDSADSVEILVEDPELNALSGHVIRVERSFSGGSVSRTVAMGQSGSTGTDSVFIDSGEQYVFTVFDEEGERVDRFGPQSIPRSLEVELTVDEEPFTRFDQLVRGVEFEVTTLEDEVIVEYDTETEELNQIQLGVYEDTLFDRQKINETNSSATSGQLSVTGFNASDQQLQYRLNGVFDDPRSEDTVRHLLDSGSFGQGVSEFQETGLFTSLLLFLGLTLSGLWRPEAAIGMGTLSIMIAFFVGFLPIGQTALIAVVSVAAILVWRMN